MHKFPKDANLRWQWVKFVQVKRANFVELSVICNIHFSLDCYEKSFLVEMGLRKQTFWCCTDDTVSSSDKFS